MESKKVKYLGLILIIVGVTSFSNHELVGDLITLIGCTVILGVCITRRLNKRIQSS